MKSKLILPALCALMMCFVACGPDNDPIDGSTATKGSFDKNGAVANGVFSVGENKKVKFSRGNLQYQASTDTWRFAENQYDFIGEDNKNISPTYSGWIDLFGWGTGNNPTDTTNIFSPSGANYQMFVDWGTNKISNGRNKANQWRTLSLEEWFYLFEVREHASHLYGSATIKTMSLEIYGIVIMPDGWSASTLPVNEGMKGWNNNEYSLDEWNDLQKEGAVFLPASGKRYDLVVYDASGSGYYWSSSPAMPFQSAHAACLLFYCDYDDYLSSTFSLRNEGHSVRLVRDL